MENAELIAAAIDEIHFPTCGITKQFLRIHSIPHELGQPVVAGVRVQREENRARVYFPVVGERFHFVVYLDTVPEPWVSGVDTEDYCNVYFRASSEELTLAQLASLTTLPYDAKWSFAKGDERRLGGARYKFSSLVLKLPQVPGELDSKLGPLLSYLEQDAAGIKVLVDQYDGGVQVHTIFHNGNTMLGGLHLEKEDIRRLAALNLEIDFDLYAEGNFFKAGD